MYGKGVEYERVELKFGIWDLGSEIWNLESEIERRGPGWLGVGDKKQIGDSNRQAQMYVGVGGVDGCINTVEICGVIGCINTCRDRDMWGHRMYQYMSTYTGGGGCFE